MKHAVLYLIVGVTLLVAALAFVWPQLSLFMASDSCTGAAGSFDFLRMRCESQQGRSGVTFDLWPFWLALAASGMGLAWIARGVSTLRPKGAGKPKAKRTAR